MKKLSKKLVALLGATVLSTGLLMGCGSSSSTTTTEVTSVAEDTSSVVEEVVEEVQEVETVADLSGTISMAGSTSMEKLANSLAEILMEKYPNLTINAEFTGSSAGVEAVVAGSVDIGNSSRNLKDSEIEAGAVENIVAIDGIAVVVHSSSTVTELSKDDLIAIYKGEITNWSEVGGEDSAIIVIGREAGSGTRGAFEEILGVEDVCAYASEIDSTGAVMGRVAATAGAIGYVSLDVVDDSVIALSLEGVEATAQNIQAGDYFLSRPFVMATKGEISEQNEVVQGFFAFVQSAEGKEIIETVGLIPAQ
ncbi:MAG: phosphate ABC transporter substrate-binding protein [Lachnospiraceae bacterium]